MIGWSPPIRADAIMQTTDYSDVTTYLTVQCLSIMQDFMILNNYLPWCCNVLICIYCISYKVIHSFINFVSGKQTDNSAAVTSLPLLSVGDCRCMIYINSLIQSFNLHGKSYFHWSGYRVMCSRPGCVHDSDSLHKQKTIGSRLTSELWRMREDDQHSPPFLYRPSTLRL